MIWGCELRRQARLVPNSSRRSAGGGSRRTPAGRRSGSARRQPPRLVCARARSGKRSTWPPGSSGVRSAPRSHDHGRPQVAVVLTCAAVVVLLEVLASGCGEQRRTVRRTVRRARPGDGAARPDRPSDGDGRCARGDVVLAFAGDMHFEAHLAGLLDEPRGALGPIAETLSAADLTMVNLESAITTRGEPEAKELEVPSRRYHFRTSPAALDVLAAAGIDLVTMANNHGADFGPIGLADTLRAIDNSPIPVIGIGRDQEAAFAPYRVSIRGTDLAFLAADGSMREGASNVWAAGPDNPGVAAAHSERPRALLAAVRSASATDDVVVVYLHWGAELQGCPTRQQRATARRAGRGGRRRRRRHPRARPARVRMAGRHLRQLRPRQLPLVPRPPPGVRCAPGPDRGRCGGGRHLDPGRDPAGRTSRAARRRGRAAAEADWRRAA